MLENMFGDHPRPFSVGSKLKNTGLGEINCCTNLAANTRHKSGPKQGAALRAPPYFGLVGCRVFAAKFGQKSISTRTVFSNLCPTDVPKALQDSQNRRVEQPAEALQESYVLGYDWAAQPEFSGSSAF